MKERNYGIDLLRMVSMLMIVVLHLLRFGGVYSSDSPAINRMIISIIDMCCICGVDCFAIISGYVGLNARHRYSSIFNLWFLVFFYSVLFSITFFIVTPDRVGLDLLVKSFFPLLSKQHWYFSAYFGLFFIMPIINKGIMMLSDIQLRNITLCLIMIFSVLSTLGNFWNKESLFNVEFGYSVLWLMVLYIVGAFLKRSSNSFVSKHKTRNWMIVFLIGVTLTVASKYIIDIISKIFGLNNSGGELFTYNSPTVLLEAVGLFMAFANLKIPYRLIKFIAYCAPSAFSVNIIHANNLVLTILFAGSFAFINKLPFYVLPFVIVVTALAIYLICTLIDILRRYLFKLIRVNQFSICLEKCGHTALKRIPNKYKKEDNESE